MPFAWRPAAGQVALIERAADDRCVTGVVTDGEDDELLVDAGPSAIVDGDEVTVSFFAPDALYRLVAIASVDGRRPGVVALTVRDIERVQRADVGRAHLALHAVLSNFDDPGELVSVVGRTVDISDGGCRVVVDQPFPAGCDPTVTIHLPDGTAIVALAAVLQAHAVEGGYEYRLVFVELGDIDRLRLADAVRGARLRRRRSVLTPRTS